MPLSKQISLFFNKKVLKKLVAYLLLIIVFYILKDFLGLFLLTFIFWYLAISLAYFFKEKSDFFISRFFPQRNTRKIHKKIFNIKFFVIIEYIIFIILIYILVTKLIPNIISELYDITKKVPEFKNYIDELNKKLWELKQIKEIWGSVNQIFNNNILSEKNLDILKNIFDQIKTAWWIAINIFLSLILSFIFIIDIEKVKNYFSWIKKTSFEFFYNEYSLISKIVVDSFGRVFKAQALIALVNTTLTTIWLLIIWYYYWYWPNFPFIYTLAIIVFIAWFIPVVWTFISSIPIIIVAITIVWWIKAWLLVVWLVAIVHSIEAYYLNPRIVSSFMEMPMSMTFLILIVSEKLMWILWLIIWVSLFYFIKELFKDIDKITKKTSKKLEKKNKIEELCEKAKLSKITKKSS